MVRVKSLEMEAGQPEKKPMPLKSKSISMDVCMDEERAHNKCSGCARKPPTAHWFQTCPA